MCLDWRALIINWISYPLLSLTSLPPTAMPDLHRGQVLGDLNLVSIFLVWSLASFEDVTAAMMWFLLLEIWVFYCLFSAAFRPKLV
ncbi:hypothetical protein C1H46_000144 [Malus baccata]|uniref:Uncharacterized protein n=1 Tax=Malus baccata TaxID=106549 RepID=A0A540NTD7_MALBA|nr:hypothetical protein C1H46_000144 [Malus baccata]